MNEYLFNLETLKIELHFEKSDYTALSDEQKRKLKSSFLWSNYGKCWVSRCKEPNLWSAKRTAEELGFTGEKRINERLTMAEQIERTAEKAEARAERMENHADNAASRAKSLQGEFNKYSQDWSWLTQPIIAGHSGSQRFAKQREKVIARYEKSFEEYRKSDYFKERAATARETAAGEKYKDIAYLDRKVKEARKMLKGIQSNIVNTENNLYKVEQGETLKNYHGEVITAEQLQNRLADYMEQWEVWEDKEGFFLNCIDDLGGINFSKDNIKVGYIVNIQRWGRCEVVGTGKVNVTYKILDDWGAGMGGTATYAEIESVIEAVEKTGKHNFKVGERFEAKTYAINGYAKPADKVTIEIIKATDKSITLQAKLLNGEPITEEAKPVTRKPSKSFKGDMWCFSYDDTYGNTFYKQIATA
jgi:hypothetical protein